MKKSVLEVVDVAIAVAVMGAVVVVARRRKGSGALSGSALLGGTQTSSSRVEIGLGSNGLSIGLRSVSQGGFASELCRAGSPLGGGVPAARALSSTPEEGMEQGWAGAQDATPAGSATAREAQRWEGEAHETQCREGEARKGQRRQRKR